MPRHSRKARKRSGLGRGPFESAAILPSCRIKVCARQPCRGDDRRTRQEPSLIRTCILLIRRPRKNARSEAVAIFYEIVYRKETEREIAASPESFQRSLPPCAVLIGFALTPLKRLGEPVSLNTSHDCVDMSDCFVYKINGDC